MTSGVALGVARTAFAVFAVVWYVAWMAPPLRRACSPTMRRDLWLAGVDITRKGGMRLMKPTSLWALAPMAICAPALVALLAASVVYTFRLKHIPAGWWHAIELFFTFAAPTVVGVVLVQMFLFGGACYACRRNEALPSWYGVASGTLVVGYLLLRETLLASSPRRFIFFPTAWLDPLLPENFLGGFLWLVIQLVSMSPIYLGALMPILFVRVYPWREE